MSRRACLAWGGAALLAWAAPARADSAAPAEVESALPGANLQGQGRLRWFGLHIYDAVLWSRQRVAAGDAQAVPLALELRYARALVGRLIAERSLDEMKGVGEFTESDGQRWLEAMKLLFPDVRAGDRITGVHHPGASAAFYVNGRAVGEVKDARFAQLFFGIWLSPKTSQPALRAALLGAGS